MKTLIFIHGADSFSKDAQYLSFLKTEYISRYTLPWEDSQKIDYWTSISKWWQSAGWCIYYPPMPNKQNARYRDWKVVFEWILARLNSKDEITLVGTSLGGCFLLKYFAEVWRFDYRVNQIHLLAACISALDSTAPYNYEFLQKPGNRVHIWHAEDDKVVPFSVGQELSEILPLAQAHFLSSDKGYGHFHGVERIVELEGVIFP